MVGLHWYLFLSSIYSINLNPITPIQPEIWPIKNERVKSDRTLTLDISAAMASFGKINIPTGSSNYQLSFFIAISVINGIMRE